MSVAHADVTFDVEGRTAGETEGLHVGEYLGLVQSCVGPGAAEAADELFVDGTAVGVDQLDLLGTAVVRVAVANDQVEAICSIKAFVVIHPEVISGPSNALHESMLFNADPLQIKQANLGNQFDSLST